MRTHSQWTAMMIGIGLAVIGAGTIATLRGSIPSTNGTVTTCVAKAARTSPTGLLGPIATVDRKGTLRAIDTDAGEDCASDEQPLTLNVRGEKGDTGAAGMPGAPGIQGPQGIQGIPGVPGAPAKSSWVTMKGDGTIGDSSGDVVIGLATGRNNIGEYEVQFNHDVSRCAATANASEFIGPFPQFIVPYVPVVGRGSNTQFGVTMFDLSGHTADTEFTLVVAC